MLVIDLFLVRRTVVASLLGLLRLDNSEGSLLGLVARLLQTTGLLGHRGLLARDNATPLVVLQVCLCEPSRRVLGTAMHHLGTRPNLLHCASLLLFHLLPVQKS